jgi:hypothetical protein
VRSWPGVPLGKENVAESPCGQAYGSSDPGRVCGLLALVVRRGRQQRGRGDEVIHADGPYTLDSDSHDADNHPHRHLASASRPFGDCDSPEHGHGHDDATLADRHANGSCENSDCDADPDSHANGHRCGAATCDHNHRCDNHIGCEPGGCRSSRSGRRVQQERGNEQHAMGVDRVRDPRGGCARYRARLVASQARLRAVGWRIRPARGSLGARSA